MTTPDYGYRAGDTLPMYVLEITDPATIDLTGAAVEFHCKRRYDATATAIILTGSVLSIANKQISVTLTESDLTVPGEYDAYWRITLADSRVISIPNSNPAHTLIVADAYV